MVQQESVVATAICAGLIGLMFGLVLAFFAAGSADRALKKHLEPFLDSEYRRGFVAGGHWCPGQFAKGFNACMESMK